VDFQCISPFSGFSMHLILDSGSSATKIIWRYSPKVLDQSQISATEIEDLLEPNNFSDSPSIPETEAENVD